MSDAEFEITNTHVALSTSNAVLWKSIDVLLSFAKPGAEFSLRQFPMSKWDGRTHLLNKKTSTFPTGLLPRVLEYMDQEGMTYQTIDRRTIPVSTSKYAVKKKWVPRPHQAECVSACLDRSRGVIVAGTGYGKTPTAAFIIEAFSRPTLFVTPDTGLREQAFQDFEDMFEKSSWLSRDIKSDAPIVVCNIQALANKDPEFFERFEVLIIDEFHHSSADSYLKLNEMCKNAYFRFGMTGTFVRTDGTDMTMHGVLSEVIYKKTTSELIEAGWLVAPHITMVRYELTGWSRLNYKQAYEQIVRHNEVNTLVSRVAAVKMNEGKQVLVLVRRKEHGEILERLIDGSAYLSGTDTLEHRDRIKRKFNNREIKCLIATGILGEGQNIPSIDVLINARFEKTEIQTKQGIGRALRKYEGKDKAEVFDFWVMGQKHLKAHSLARIMSYKSERAFKIKIVRSESFH